MRNICTLCVVCVALAGVVASAATEVETLMALWGRDMTVEQLWRALDPSALAGMSPRMRATKVTWGEPLGPATAARHEVQVSPLSSGAALSSLPDISYVFSPGEVDIYADVAGYGGYSKITSPRSYAVPYIWVRARLCWNGTTIDQAERGRYNAYYVAAGGNYTITGPGDYQCVAYHYIQFPTGYSPAEVYGITYSDVYHLIYW